MKTKLAMLVALTAAGGSFGAYADPLPLPAVQPPALNVAAVKPSLFPSEQGAFKALEVASHLVEAAIVQNGCTARSFPIQLSSNNVGTTDAVVDKTAFRVNFAGSSNQFGRKYTINSLLAGSTLDGLNVTGLSGSGSYNIGSTIQEEHVSFNLQSPQNPLVNDSFYGSVIKDYWRLVDLQAIPTTADNFFENQGELVSTVVDYGYQQISKKGYVAAKYWQQSQTWRQNGVNAGTRWVKTLVTPTGTNCGIEVKIQGYGVQPADTIDGFNEKGTIAVTNATPAVGPFKN